MSDVVVVEGATGSVLVEGSEGVEGVVGVLGSVGSAGEAGVSGVSDGEYAPSTMKAQDPVDVS